MDAFWKILQIRHNNWKLSDVPEISVNRFSRDSTKSSEIIDSKAFFLTHCDYQIMTNIFDSRFLQNLSDCEDETRCLYMHKVSYEFLKYWTTTTHVAMEFQDEAFTLLQTLLADGKIKLLETNRPIKIYAKSSCVTVTPLSAGHHAGSIMLLLEKSPIDDEIQVEFRILHTGCCRVNLRDLRLMTPLHDPMTGKPKKINTLYLDTSFCTKNVTELPSRRVVSDQLFEYCRKKIENDPEIRFELVDELVPARSPVATCAHFLRCIFENSMEKIHVPEALATFLRSIPKFPDLTTTDALTGSEDPINHFHCGCGRNDDNEFCAEDGEWALGFEVTEISLQSKFSSHGSEEALPLFADERNWKQHGYEKTVYEEGATSVRGIYCHNLSRYEQARLMNYLNVDPKNVNPLYSPFGMTVREMRKYLQEACDAVSAAANDEPCEIVDDYPSYFYDLTGAPNYKILLGQ